MRATILLISFLFSSVTLLGQEMYDEDYTLKDNQGSLKRIWKKAQREHKAKNYDNALGLYELLAERDSSNVKFLYEAASLADTLNAFVMAEYYYAKAVKHENRANHPTLDFQYAKVLQTLGHYDQAIRYYQRFREEQDRTGKVSNAQLYLASQLQDECKAAKRMVEESSSIYSNLKMLGDPVNSKNTSDFAPYQDNGELYFSRLQYTDQKRENRGLKIYKHRKEEKGYYKAVQTDDNNAYFSLSSDAQHLYEINCTDLNQEFGSRGCKIYRRDLVKGAWSRAKILPNTINLEGCVNTQPAIGTDSEGNDVLFFSSNRPGGEGKMDIWSSIILKDDDGYLSYEDPVNVGQVNSSADEISPYFHGKCNTLYFSSDRKPSIGGFDIYEATFNGRGYERINPLPYPINSSFDDVDFFRSGTGDKVFFASQRLPEEEIGGEEDVKGCCLDIYEANLEMPVDLDVLVYCGNAPVTEANYKMEAMLSKGAEMAIDTSGSLDAPIRLKPNEEYQFYISKAGYTTAKFPILTNDVCEPTQLSERVYIRPLKNLMIDVRKKVAGGDAPADSITLEIEEYEDGFKIDEVFSEKANIVKLAVEIEKKYRVYVKSPGYEEEIFEIEIPDVKKACLTEKTITLTPKIVDGLEIDVAIYFHDDIPARKFRTGTARDGAVDVSYKTTYDDYVNMRDEYKRELSDFYLNNGEFDAANQVGIEIDNFFNNQVEDGFDNLKLYADAVAKYFSKPNMPSISIVIQGSASPTARTPGGIKYNQYLSSRRINSVKNYLRS
ncbi:MAG: hypothetical protein AAF806_14760, partial [Bacteroidota bacterium]